MTRTRFRPATWWSARSMRERALLGAMIVAAVGYLGVVGVARPLFAARTDALAAIARSDQALARLAASQDAGDWSRGAAADAPVTVVLTDTADAFGLTIRRIEPEGAGARLSIEDADFDAVLDWIAALEAENGLRVLAVDLDRRPEPGVVSATLAVAR